MNQSIECERYGHSIEHKTYKYFDNERGFMYETTIYCRYGCDLDDIEVTDHLMDMAETVLGEVNVE